MSAASSRGTGWWCSVCGKYVYTTESRHLKSNHRITERKKQKYPLRDRWKNFPVQQRDNDYKFNYKMNIDGVTPARTRKRRGGSGAPLGSLHRGNIFYQKGDVRERVQHPSDLKAMPYGWKKKQQPSGAMGVVTKQKPQKAETCKNCGTSLKSKANFCGKCGTPRA